MQQGGYGQCMNYGKSISRKVSVLRLSNVIKEYMESLYKKLNAHNKDIVQKDKEEITNLINNLKVNEDKLYKTVIYADKYKRLIEVFGEKDEDMI